MSSRYELLIDYELWIITNYESNKLFLFSDTQIYCSCPEFLFFFNYFGLISVALIFRIRAWSNFLMSHKKNVYIIWIFLCEVPVFSLHLEWTFMVFFLVRKTFFDLPWHHNSCSDCCFCCFISMFYWLWTHFCCSALQNKSVQLMCRTTCQNKIHLVTTEMSQQQKAFQTTTKIKNINRKQKKRLANH